jgi:hypothetical protein
MSGPRRVEAWRLLLLASAGLYLLALLSPGLVPDDGRSWNAQTDGFICLLFGPLSWMVDPIMLVAWSANLVYFGLAVCALLPGGARIPPATGLAPFLIGLTALGVKTSVTDIESSAHARVAVHLGSGGWLWLAALLVFAPVFFLKRRRP